MTFKLIRVFWTEDVEHLDVYRFLLTDATNYSYCLLYEEDSLRKVYHSPINSVEGRTFTPIVTTPANLADERTTIDS